jgi:hypothetical protein
MTGVRSWDDLRSSGLLWLINRVVFHPRGWALGMAFDCDDEPIGWKLLGDGSEPWRFEIDEHEEDALFEAVKQTLGGTL